MEPPHRRNAHIVPRQHNPYQRLLDMVLNSVDSPHTKRAYGRAITDFLAWHDSAGRPPLVKATVQAYRTHLLTNGLKPASVNQRLAAVKKLAREAADNDLLDPVYLVGIEKVPGAKQQGRRAGRWLTVAEAQELLTAPDTTTLKGLRDRAVLAVALGAGLRRSEIIALTFAHLQQREGRWAIVDLVGKHGRIRSVPIPRWVMQTIEAWQSVAGFAPVGYVFRPLHKHEVLIGSQITAQLIHTIVREYAEQTGLSPLAPHDLRRTFAKTARTAGSDLDQIQASLGHASVKTTETYVGDTQSFTDAPADRLGYGLK